MKKLVLKKDIVIKAGTLFTCADGRKSTYVSGNYATSVGLTNDSCGELMYAMDEKDEKLDDWFMELIE